MRLGRQRDKQIAEELGLREFGVIAADVWIPGRA